jgi:hypothetical protein
MGQYNQERRIAATQLHELTPADTAFLHDATHDQLSNVFSFAKAEQPPNAGIIAAVAGICIARMEPDNPSGVRSIIFGHVLSGSLEVWHESTN